MTSPVEGVQGTTLYEALGVGGQPVAGRRLAIVGWTHGNEPVGGDVLDRLAERIEAQLCAGSVLAVRSNLAAFAAQLRHTPGGVDLNRLWDRRTLRRLAKMRPEHRNYEEERAVTLSPLLLACDAILDLHSTSRPTPPFLLFRDDQAHAAMARLLKVPNLVTGLHESGILAGGLAANVGLAPAERSPRLGFTFEAGQHDDPGNLERAWDVAWRALHGLGLWSEAPPPTDVRGEVFEVQERFRQAPENAVPYRFVGYDGGAPGSGRQGALRKLHSFEEVQADEVIVRRGRNQVVRAHAPFTMLMPSPDTAPGTDLYYVTQPRHGGLAEGVRRTDERARGEAMAIERMLDLLADDDFARGSTWIAFDNRRLLDLCGSVVARTLRLPRGDPDRQIVVVGRGEGSGDEAERRAGQRYRQAMRRAVSDGLPIERIQLLRGAPLQWLDALTSHGMLELLQQRQERGEGTEGVRMLVSLRQPNTVSILAAGNLRRALQTGDTRHVRVALVIEAASIEPDGGSARVRIIRAGMVSARIELIRAAFDLIEALREEHRHLVRHGSLAHMASVRDLIQDDGALSVPADPDQLADLRNALYRLQLRLWLDALRHELTQPVRIRSEYALGRWLARTMAATGILDAQALENLCIRRTSKEWVAEPARIAEAEAALNNDADLLDGTGALPAVQALRVRPSLPQPFFAEEVDADDLERWVGWKRFVRGVQMLADTRGKDLDLAFTEPHIRTRITRWFAQARSRAAAEPGSVLVVVAGDGLNPQRERLGQAWQLLNAHHELISDPNVRYLRIQHAQGTHLSWMKDFLWTLQQRPAGQSVSLQFEAEHGATVNVVMIATGGDGDTPDGPWSLEGWSIQACGVVLSDLEGSGSRDYKVAMFTDDLDSTAEINQELIHFGRAHCEGLLKQAGSRLRGPKGALAPEEAERAMVHQIARWIERVRDWNVHMPPVVDDREARTIWVARSLGIADERLARALAAEMTSVTPVERAASALWASVTPWPGPLWSEIRNTR